MSTVDLHKLVTMHGGIRAAARHLNMPESTIRYRLKKATADLLVDDGSQHEIVFGSNRPPHPVEFAPYPDRPRYFILSSAQDSSDVHTDFMACLQRYASYLVDCEILLSGFTYSKTLFEDHDTRSSKVGFHPSIDPFIVHDRVNIGDGLAFCGEMNTLPTATTPLSGLQTYTRQRWGIFPHVKVQLESVPTMKSERSKQIMTTGAVTLPNYIRKKAGIKASFHHIVGAVLVELAPDGSFWCRHLLATSYDDGSFYDLDMHITSDRVSHGNRVEAITYGDIHHEKLDPVVAMTTWGYDTRTGTKMSNDCLADYLNPNFEFYHDLSDFTARNHHNIKDHHHRFKTHRYSTANVLAALQGCAGFLKAVAHDDRMSVVVESNHDMALVTWLKTADYRDDPENARFFLQTQDSYYGYLEAGVSNPPVFEDILRANDIPKDTVFVNEDKSFIIAGDIECGMHGHLGANGARANPRGFAKMGLKSNTAHTHSPSILDGGYVCGVSGKTDMGYNKGLSSWAQAHTITYPNGKRTIMTMMGDRWFA